MPTARPVEAATIDVMGPEEAREHFDLWTRELTPASSQLELDLTIQGVGKIAMPIPYSDYEYVLDSFEECFTSAPGLMASTSGRIDARFGSDVGYERKERAFNKEGKQIKDPKSLFHFHERARKRWEEQFAAGPSVIRRFLADGFELHDELARISRAAIAELEETHPGITAAHFYDDGNDFESYSFLRLLSYDDYVAEEEPSDVAKAHFDIGHFTIQAFADAPGFWGAPGGPKTERVPYDTVPGSAYMFAGRGYENLYGASARFRPLYHGVGRQLVLPGTYVPRRRSVILFTDAPYIDPRVQASQTLPELY